MHDLGFPGLFEVREGQQTLLSRKFLLYLEHDPFSSVWFVKYTHLLAHKTGHVISDSFHRILQHKHWT